MSAQRILPTSLRGVVPPASCADGGTKTGPWGEDELEDVAPLAEVAAAPVAELSVLPEPDVLPPNEFEPVVEPDPDCVDVLE